MAPHSQVRDVDSVEDDIFHAATEVMPIGKVFLCSAHQTSNEHLRVHGVGNRVRFPGYESAGTFLELPTMQLFYKKLETPVSPVSVLKLEAH